MNKKIILILITLIPISLVQGQNYARAGYISDNSPAIVNQGANTFEDFNDVTNLPGWSMDNQSTPVGTSGWFQGNNLVFNAQSGAANAYIAANFSNTAGTDICNWLIMPDIGYIQNLSFWTRTTQNSTFPDRLLLLHSPTGATNTGDCINGFGDFTSTLIEINPTLAAGGYPEDWTQFSTNIDTTGVVAFVYYVANAGINGNNSNYIGIDSLDLIAGVPTSEMSLTMTNDAGVFTQDGQTITYTQRLTNNGPHDAHNTTVSSTIPDALTYVTNNCSATLSGSILTWNIGTLTPSTINCDIQLTVNGVGAIAFQASVTADEIDNNLNDNTATSVINGPARVIPSLGLFGLIFLLLTLIVSTRIYNSELRFKYN